MNIAAPKTADAPKAPATGVSLMQRIVIEAKGLAADFWKDGDGTIQKKNKKETAAPESFFPAKEKSVAPEIWQASRFEVLEAIWGKGRALPGGDALVEELVSPLGLNKQMNVLDLGARFGAIGRKLAEEFGIYVTGLEYDSEMADYGMKLSIAAGKARHAPVTVFDPANFKSDKHYDCVIARALFFHVVDKPTLFAAINAAMKPKGQIVFTDYIMESDASSNPAIARWLLADHSPTPLSMSEMVLQWEDLGFDVRTNQDQTDMYRQVITKTLAEFVGFLRTHPPDAATGAFVAKEVERWSLRLKAMENGLKFCRFYAIKR